MLSKCRSSPIPTFHFKKQLPSPPTPPFLTKKISNGSKQADPSLPRTSRLGPLLPFHESTHFQGSALVYSFCSNALKISAKMGFLCEGKQLHGHLVKLGLCNIYLQNQILTVYVRCKEIDDAHKMFDEMPERNAVVWNTVLCGLVDERSKQKSCLYLGFSYFRRMLLESACPDDITFNVLFRACIELNDVEIGRQLHCFIFKLGFDSSCFVSTALVDFYAKCVLVEEARCVFDDVLYRDLVMWNVMVYCYASNGLVKEAIGIFSFMRSEGVKTDEFTVSCLLNLCSTSISFDLGEQIHGLIIKESLDSDVLVASGLVDMYAKNENTGDARKMFDMMAIRNVVSWTTMIVGYGKCEQGKEAIRLFQEMLQKGFYPDELTLASILSSCGNLGVTIELVQVHGYTIKLGFQSFISNVNALINAYSKCGSIVSASQCFGLIADPDLFTWTSIICAYAFHGLAKEATECFEKMLANGIRPDKISFLGVLAACSHGGLISKGLHYFEMMTKKYHILPDSEHYTCLIDLLGRAGLLDEACNVLAWMPTEAEPNALGAFIGACKVHRNVRLAELAAEKLFVLKTKDPVNYCLMSNIYSSEGRWLDVARMRKMMRNNCYLKVPGFSWVEIAGDVYTFASSDQSLPRALEVYAMLGLLHNLIKEESDTTRFESFSELFSP
ncbi:hypothetical protein UlMin_022500 [Ulmus minor]